MPSDVDRVVTPSSAHIFDMNRQESMSAVTGKDGGTARKEHDDFAAMPISLADLQDDDDKSSLESGQVSPEAYDEREGK